MKLLSSVALSPFSFFAGKKKMFISFSSLSFLSSSWMGMPFIHSAQKNILLPVTSFYDDHYIFIWTIPWISVIPPGRQHLFDLLISIAEEAVWKQSLSIWLEWLDWAKNRLPIKMTVLLYKNICITVEAWRHDRL